MWLGSDGGEPGLPSAGGSVGLILFKSVPALHSPPPAGECSVLSLPGAHKAARGHRVGCTETGEQFGAHPGGGSGQSQGLAFRGL